MKEYVYTPKYVCSREIRFGIEDGKLHNVRFKSGCEGNLKAIGKLVEGQDAARIAEMLEGNDCQGRGTSCADQLSKAIREALEEEKN
ncbi:MAG: TIGR03905 family TSCPD domain-containing protein [Oscillospiraceae bacterium]|nr:TIGR03905 family TSCPD domain-containing protein [Oscillospiraceae bacterium]